MPKDARILQYTWVDKPEKARWAVADRRTDGPCEDIVHCPAPAPESNKVVQVVALLRQWPVYCFDVVSAFPHAEENDPSVYVRAPKEWVEMGENRGGLVWHLVRNVYGRRPAGASFRDFFESTLVKLGFQRGSTEPCLYRHTSGALITHHVDDGKLTGPDHVCQEVLAELKSTCY